MAASLFHKRRLSPVPQAGQPPGTLSIDPGATPTVVHVIAYGPDRHVEREIQDLDSLAEFLGKWPVVWVNVDGLGDGEAMKKLAGIFSLHRLVLEDVVSVPQRPKVEQYGQDLFVVTRMTALAEQLEVEQVSLFLGKGLVLTFQERPGDCLDPVRDRIRKGLGRIRTCEADYLAYSILDAVIDNYFPVLEEYGERLEDLEERVIEDPSPRIVAEIHRAKRDLLTLRRAIWPQRDSMNWLLREPFPLISADTRMYLRDCYDHISHIIDMVETYRELASGLMEAYQSSISNRMNEIMKVLTIIATIFIPLSFVAGLYGMNFDPDKSPLNMPELRWYWGYPLALCIMATVALGLLAYFRRKGWLGSPGAKPPRDKAPRE